jgi:hypothetical protein
MTAISYRMLVLGACATALFATPVLAQKSGQGARSNTSTYQADRAACLSGQSHQDRQTCLREAGAAQAEARRGGLDDKGADYERNKLARCDAQTVPADREMCIRMMKGAGTASGSVEGGGIYRELVEVQPAGG